MKFFLSLASATLACAALAASLGFVKSAGHEGAVPTQAAKADQAAQSATTEAKPAAKAADSGVRFESVDVFVDSGESPLSAYQFELQAPPRDGFDAVIVGIEGGEHAAYASPPYYDPAALQQQRVVIAAFSVASEERLPRGRVRVARLHMQLRPVAVLADKSAKPGATGAGAPVPGAAPEAPEAAPAAPAAPAKTEPAKEKGEDKDAETAKPVSRGAVEKRKSAPESRYSAVLVTAAGPTGAAIKAEVTVSTEGARK